MTSIEAILVTLMPTLSIFLSVAKAAIQNNLSKFREFLGEIFVMEFRYSETIFFGIHSNFFDSEIYCQSLL